MSNGSPFYSLKDYVKLLVIKHFLENTLNSNEAQSVLTLSPFLDKARRTDDYKERAKLLNRCIYICTLH